MILSLLALSFNTLSTHALPWAMKQSKRIIKPREGISNGSLLLFYLLSYLLRLHCCRLISTPFFTAGHEILANTGKSI